MRGIAGVAAALWIATAAAGSPRASCVLDTREPDDTCVSATGFVLGGQAQARNFCDDAEDWVTFNACPGRTYTIETSALGPSADTLLELFDRDCASLLASDDNGNGGGASRISSWSPAAPGSYHLRIRQKDGTAGDDRDYDVVVTGDTSPCATWVRELTPIAPTTDRSLLAPVPAPDGGFYVTGSFLRATGQGRDIWLARLDPAGAVVWQKGFDRGTNNWEVGSDMARTPSGDLVVAGQLFDIPPGTSNGFGMKLDRDGNVTWQTRLGGPESGLYGVEPTADGGAILVGEETPDAWVVRLSSAGAVLWSKHFGGEGYEFLFSAVATADGGFAAAGASDSVGQGSFDGWVVKFDGSGNAIWQSVYGGAGDDRIYDLAATSDAGLLVVAEIDLNSGHSRGWLAKLDASGEMTWQREVSFGGAETWIIDAAEAADGGYFLLGGFTSTVTSAYVSWLARLDASGNVVWLRTYDGAGFPADLAALADGGVLATAMESEGPPTARVLHVGPTGAVDSCDALRASAALFDEALLVRTPWVLAGTDVASSPVPAGLTSQARSGPTVDYCPCATPSFLGSLELYKVPDTLILAWPQNAAPIDVIRGDLDVLRATGGDFSQALAAVPGTGQYTCMADDSTGTDINDALCCPDDGVSSFFFLLRPDAPICPGSYDDGSPSQIGSRDQEILGAPDECP